MLSADKGSSSYQLGWKSPGNMNERSHFRCGFPHPLLPILNHMPEWQVLWECSIGPTDPFSHLKTKPNQVAPKLLLRNAFCVMHSSSWMEISFSISQSLAVFLFVWILLSFPNSVYDSTAHGIIHVVSNLKGPKISTDPTNIFHSWQFIPLETIISCVGLCPKLFENNTLPWPLDHHLAWAASPFLQPDLPCRDSLNDKMKGQFLLCSLIPSTEVPCLGKQVGGITTISLSKCDHSQSQYCFSNEGGNFWLLQDHKAFSWVPCHQAWMFHYCCIIQWFKFFSCRAGCLPPNESYEEAQYIKHVISKPFRQI